jgi:hypothetical protein
VMGGCYGVRGRARRFGRLIGVLGVHYARIWVVDETALMVAACEGKRSPNFFSRAFCGPCP